LGAKGSLLTDSAPLQPIKSVTIKKTPKPMLTLKNGNILFIDTVFN